MMHHFGIFIFCCGMLGCGASVSLPQSRNQLPRNTPLSTLAVTSGYDNKGFVLPLDCREYLKSSAHEPVIVKACKQPISKPGSLGFSHGSFADESEPALWQGVPDNLDTCRLMIRPSFSPSSLVRIEKTSNQVRMLVKRADVRQMEIVKMTMAQWTTFMELLTQYSFWSQPRYLSRGGFDGATLVIECARGNRYHVVSRRSPEGNKYAEAFEYIFVLAGLWDE